jgi:hypothetical protein
LNTGSLDSAPDDRFKKAGEAPALLVAAEWALLMPANADATIFQL